MTVPTPKTTASWRALYSLDPDIAFLNHGSFGAVPIPVQEDFQNWHRQIEANPVGFMVSVVPEGTEQARAALAEFVGVPTRQLAFVTNATMGINIFARALQLSTGDEVLATSQEYGATQKAKCTYGHRPEPATASQKGRFPATAKENGSNTFLEGVLPHEGTVLQPHHRSHRVHAAHGGTVCQSPRGRYRNSGGRCPRPRQH